MNADSAIRSEPRVRLGVVVPFWNEEEVLPLFLSELKRVLQRMEHPTEVIAVDDGSTDDGPRLVEEASEDWPELVLVRLTRNFGKEGAIKAGLAETRSDAVIVMDADLQHPPSLIPEMLQRWRQTTCWVVAGVKQGPVPQRPLKRVGSTLFYWAAERLTGLPLRNRADFVLLDRRAVDLLGEIPERVTIFRGLLAWLRLPTQEIPFTVPTRAAGYSRWSYRRLGNLAIDMLTGFTNAPLRLMTFAALLFTGFAAILGVQTLYVYLSGEAVEGFTTVILVVLLTGAALSVGLGIVGEYLARVYEEVKRRPQYVVERVSDGPGKNS